MAAVRLLRPSSPSIPFTSSRRSVHPQIRWALHPRPGLSPSLHLTGTPPQIHQATSLLASKPSPSSSSRPEQSLPRPDLPLTSSESGAPPLLRPISDQQIRCPQSLPSPLLPAIPYTVFFQPRPDN